MSKPMIKKSHVGALHRQLGVPLGHPIPMAKLQKAAKSKNVRTRRRAQFAINAKSFKH